MQRDLTQGSIRGGLIRFSLPLIAGNLLQQFYNIADTLIVGRFLGNVALAAVGSAFSLMVLLTSLVLGLCMGSGVVFSQLYGEGSRERLKTAIANAFVFIAILSLVLTAASYALLNAFSRFYVSRRKPFRISRRICPSSFRASSSRSCITSSPPFCAASAIRSLRCFSCWFLPSSTSRSIWYLSSCLSGAFPVRHGRR